MDTRERLAFEVREILKATGHTAILVTHNQAEAFAIADRIGVMSKGRIAQWDTPYNLHHHPADAFVRDFIRSEALEEQREQVSRAAAERNAGGQDQGPGRPRERRAHPGRRHFRPGVNPPTASPSATRP